MPRLGWITVDVDAHADGDRAAACLPAASAARLWSWTHGDRAGVRGRGAARQVCDPDLLRQSFRCSWGGALHRYMAYSQTT